jgi:putative transposase
LWCNCIGDVCQGKSDARSPDGAKRNPGTRYPAAPLPPDYAALHPGYDRRMVLYRRNFVPGGTFFFTAAIVDRRTGALIENIGLLRHACRLTCQERPFSINAVVVLPDHLHIITTLPADDADYPGRWKRCKSLFSRLVAKRSSGGSKNQRGEYALWQRRYWEHTIRDDVDFERHVNYIHYNPVKHGLVTRVADWPYSSFHRYVARGILPSDWAGDSSELSGRFGE